MPISKLIKVANVIEKRLKEKFPDERVLLEMSDADDSKSSHNVITNIVHEAFKKYNVESNYIVAGKKIREAILQLPSLKMEFKPSERARSYKEQFEASPDFGELTFREAGKEQSSNDYSVVLFRSDIKKNYKIEAAYTAFKFSRTLRSILNEVIPRIDSEDINKINEMIIKKLSEIQICPLQWGYEIDEATNEYISAGKIKPSR